MDRDLGKLKKSLASTTICARQAHASRIAYESNPPMPARHVTQTAASSKAHDNDGTFSKEFNQ
jgi:hypothetical protein